MKVGEYARTKSGGIGKIIEIDNNASCSHIITDNETFGLGWDGEQVNWDFITEIVKSSPNIIDLIEVGDYVNGHRIDFTNSNNKLSYEDKCIGFYDGDGDIILFENDIKSTVTKEQFKAMEYKVEV